MVVLSSGVGDSDLIGLYSKCFIGTWDDCWISNFVVIDGLGRHVIARVSGPQHNSRT